MNRQVILLGLGGHAQSVIDILELGDYNILGYTAPAEQSNPYEDIPYLGDDEAVSHYDPQKTQLVNSLGSVADTTKRKKMFETFKSKGYTFVTLIHPNAYVSPRAICHEGVQVMAGAIVQPFASIGENTIINSNAVIEHGSSIGENCHIAPGVTISGDVQIGSSTHIGTGASIIQEIKIDNNVVVGAGSVVIKDIKENTIVVGVPAKEVSK